jgi:hypothetical protein
LRGARRFSCHAAAKRHTSAALCSLWFLCEIREIRSEHQPTIPSEWLVCEENSVERKPAFVFLSYGFRGENQNGGPVLDTSVRWTDLHDHYNPIMSSRGSPT